MDMQKTHYLESFEKFMCSLQHGDFGSTNDLDPSDQSQILDYFINILKSIPMLDESEVRFHPEFFLFPRIEDFFSHLFTSLDSSLSFKINEVFEHCCIFIISCTCPKTNSVICRLMENLKKCFPHLSEMYNSVIASITKEFFQPTIGDFIKHHRRSIDHFKGEFPFLYKLFIIPLNTILFQKHRLFNFYCNPSIYYPIIDYLANLKPSKEGCYAFPKNLLKRLEECLRIIRSQTNDESWKELTLKAYNLCKSRKKTLNLEDFANKSSGLLGEIRIIAQFIREKCHPKDEIVFLPEKNGKSCDCMVIRHKTNKCELIECKTKSPRHGLDVNTVGDLQIWDDLFNNFSDAICSYFYYLQEKTEPIFGLKLTDCFPLFSTFEGSDYGNALPLINDLMQGVTLDIPLGKWTSEQRLIHLIRALFLCPLVINTDCIPLDSENSRLKQRQQTIKEVFQKDWVSRTIELSVEQLKKTYQRKKDEGYNVSKMYVALDIVLSSRLLQDPLSNYDGNIEETVKQALLEAFQPFKEDISSQGLDLDLFIVES